MKRSNKKNILIIMILGIFLLTGCTKFSLDFFNASEEEQTEDKVTPSLKDETIDEKDNAKSASGDSSTVTNAPEENTSPTPASIQPSATINLPIYSVNAETGEIEPVNALMPEGSEITPELIVATVLEAMADQSILLETDRIEIENKTVIVSFNKDKSPATDMGSGYEAAILDAIALSLIENLDDYNQVIYRLEGEAYVSGHIELGIDEVYLGDN